MSKKTKKQGKPKYKKGQRKGQEQVQHGNSGASNAQPRKGATPGASSTPAAAPRRLNEPATDPSPLVMLEPLAPLIVRSGRPFDAQAGPDAPRFPPPSTLAGCLRTAWARQQGTDFEAALLEQAVAGPLLARLDAEGRPLPLAPKPADAHYFGQGTEARCLRAEPQAFADGCGADLPAGLCPVRLLEAIEEKGSQGPRWWAWEDLIAWRADPKPALAIKPLDDRGWSPPGGDRRAHVAIDAATQASEASEAGRLFQTEGLDLQPDNPWLKEKTAPAELRLIARFSQSLQAGLVHLGGERRLARLQPLPESNANSGWPVIPEGWLSQIHAQGGLSLTLLTPGPFSAGYRPGWLLETQDGLQGEPPVAPGVQLQLVAVALERWQPHSGWDLAKQQARATRKLVSAGATYWFKLRSDPDEAALAALWLASLCDTDRDRRDGYGLALPAPWTPTV